MNQTPTAVANAHPTECRLIIDPPAAGGWNMAVDEALLGDAAENGVATLRFYQWSEPTLSLGYFQSHVDRQQHQPSRNCPIVRRQTGGGAIVHDRELTYSVSLPGAHPLARQTQQLYAAVHDVFIAELNAAFPADRPRWSLFRRYEASRIAAANEPFLCFQRQANGDVLLIAECTQSDAAFPGAVAISTAWKILGSAQRRHRGAVLQHGSLLLDKSPAAPELPGLRDLTTLSADVGQLANTLSVRLGTMLNTPLVESALPPNLKSKVDELANTKYNGNRWSNRR